MHNKDLIRLQHMLDSAKAILRFVEGKNRNSIDTDRLLLSGIIREFEILGEAAGKISKETKSQFSNLPWQKLIGMRNRLIHVYFDIDHDIVWKTIHDSLPTLSLELETVIKNFHKN